MKQLNNEIQVEFMKSNIIKMLKKNLNLLTAVYETRMTFMNEIKNLTLKK